MAADPAEGTETAVSVPSKAAARTPRFSSATSGESANRAARRPETDAFPFRASNRAASASASAATDFSSSATVHSRPSGPPHGVSA